MQLPLLVVFAVAFVSAVQFYQAPEDTRVPSSYILTFPRNVSDESITAYIDKLKRESGVVVQHVYNVNDEFRAFAAYMSPESLQSRLLEDHILESIEENQKVQLESNLQCNQQTTSAWNLARVSQLQPQTTLTPYRYTLTGAGVNSYVIDTGILITHNEFGGRASWGYPTAGGVDCNGHGTHVAGTIAGAMWGIAKGASVIAVKVLDCNGSGTMAGIIAGVEWVTRDYNSKTRAANANMSLGGGNSAALNSAVTASVNAGITYIVAAGNSNANACNTSPANGNSVITVAASSTRTLANGQEEDIRTSWSNWGSCCHLFAPGDSITAAWNTGNSALSTISGTSMASPHVAGRVTLLQQQNANLTPAAAKSSVTSGAVSGLINMMCSGACASTPNRMLHSAC